MRLPSRMLNWIGRDALWAGAVVVRVAGDARLDGGLEHVADERMEVVPRHDGKRSSRPPVLRRSAVEVLRPPEGGEHVGEAPAVVAEVGPRVVVDPLSPGVVHAVDRARAAEDLAPRVRDRAGRRGRTARCSGSPSPAPRSRARRAASDRGSQGWCPPVPPPAGGRRHPGRRGGGRRVQPAEPAPTITTSAWVGRASAWVIVCRRYGRSGSRAMGRGTEGGGGLLWPPPARRPRRRPASLGGTPLRSTRRRSITGDDDGHELEPRRSPRDAPSRMTSTRSGPRTRPTPRGR